MISIHGKYFGKRPGERKLSDAERKKLYPNAHHGLTKGEMQDLFTNAVFFGRIWNDNEIL